MRFLVVVPSYIKEIQDARWLLGRTVRACRAREPMCPIAVVDDGSPRHPQKNALYKELMDTTGCSIKYRPLNEGYAKTINFCLQGALNLGIDVVITLNSDCEMVTPFVNKLQEIFLSDPSIAVVGCKLLYPSGQIQHAGFEVTDKGTIEMFDRSGYHGLNDGESNNARFIMGVTGAFQAIRLSALKDIDLYSEKYFLAYEDVEFCIRTWNKGYKIWYEPSILGVHFEGATRGTGLTENEIKSENQIESDLKYINMKRVRRLVMEANELALSPAENEPKAIKEISPDAS